MNIHGGHTFYGLNNVRTLQQIPAVSGGRTIVNITGGIFQPLIVGRSGVTWGTIRGIGPRTREPRANRRRTRDSSKVLESNRRPLGLSPKYHELDLQDKTASALMNPKLSNSNYTVARNYTELPS
ncbi:hypothetical protein K0M31_005537 [Melipona bicolor]|uniref:Uncharacterized protein n=1 Tax=Melipona bicolor TaxID=60889 RepID=A0AA40FVU6_9HYME|nr:hypothetical protein K0M31_005537 [Melipona bicolor]